MWQLMRFNILQLLKNLRFHSQGKEMTDADILNWANNKVTSTGRTSRMESFKVFLFEIYMFSVCFASYMFQLSPLFFPLFVLLCSFQDKNLSNGLFFLELLSSVEPRVVNWNLVSKGETGIFSNNLLLNSVGSYLVGNVIWFLPS